MRHRLYGGVRGSLCKVALYSILDGVHPTHNVRVAYGWIKAGVQKQVMSNTGRSRLNINGAYNPRSKEIIYRNEETINAKSTGMLILDILDKYPNAKKLHIIMDNAGYNRANFIKTFENHSRVNLIYLSVFIFSRDTYPGSLGHLHLNITPNYTSCLSSGNMLASLSSEFLA